jgi:HEAT repeat protein
MDTIESRLARDAAVFAVKRAWVALMLALSCTGCKTTPTNPFLANHRGEEASQDETTERADADASKSDASSTVDLTVLEKGGWFEKVSPPFEQRDPAERRWRHQEVDRLLARSPQDRPDLSSVLASTDAVAAVNAAIVMAHWGIGEPIQPLVAAVREKSLPTSQRCAAAEALGLVRPSSPAPQLRELLQEFAGPVDKNGPSPTAEGQNPELSAVLIHALTRHAQPDDEKWFTAALRSPAWYVRSEGLAAWAAIPDQDLPLAAVDLRSDQDPRVRAAAVRAIAAHHDPHAVEYLQQALNDRVPDVRAVAVAALGDLGSEEAHAMLSKLKKSRSELTRAASVTALAAAGMRDEVEAAAKDTSQHVRLAVAQTLGQAAQEGRQVAAQSVATAQDLTRDASAEVQRQAITSLAAWPIEQAGPVLLLALSEGGYTARKEAAKQLADRWPAAAGFPVDAVAERRGTALAELKKLWIQQYGEVNDAVAAVTIETQQLITLSADRIREVQNLVAALKQANLPQAARREALATLAAAGPQLVPVLEQRIDLGGPLPRELYEDVLPGVSPVFAVLERLSSQDVLQRRAAATELVTQAADAALSPLALARLAELVEAEKDPVVWRGALMAVADDSRDTAVRMAYTAIGHASVEVRRRACDYLAAHGDPRHVRVLVPVLDDPDATVVSAAVRALGYVGMLDDPQPLARLLNAPDKQLRLEAAASLARLRAVQGVTALERLALDADLNVRVQAAQTMGGVADPAFLPTLMAMLGDRANVQRAAMLSLAQIAGSDVAAQEEGVVLTNDEKVHRWQLWYRDHQDQVPEKR